MNAFEILLLCSLVAYSLEFLFLRIGLSKADKLVKKNLAEPTVTVIVAARNEEHNIEPCLTSLVKLDYPHDKMEILVINDHSTDKTFEIMTRFSEQYGFLRAMQAKKESGNLKGKTNAITQAIESSTGEILLFTDADCIVSPAWIRETVQCFDEQTGVVGGFTVLQANSVFEGIQALDWLILFSTSSGTAGWKIPLTAIGNNLSVRRAAYEETGGYRKIPFSVTEDYALVRAILEKTNYKLHFPLLKNAFISSYACDSWKQLYRQKQRWGIGGLDMITHGFLILAVSWTMSLLILLGIVFSSLPLWGGIVATKIIIDTIYIFSLLRKINRISYLRYILLFEVYFTCYVILIPFVALFSKNAVWKERKL